MREVSFERDLALMSWREVKRDGDFVYMRQGTGETGWWHDHKDGTFCGTHPTDYDRKSKAYKCRDCGVSFAPKRTKPKNSAPSEGW